MRTPHTLLAPLMLVLSSVVGCHATAPAPQCPPSAPAATPSPEVALEKSPIPYDLPRMVDFAGTQFIFFVDVSLDGTISADGQPIDVDDILRTSAKRALQ